MQVRLTSEHVIMPTQYGGRPVEHVGPLAPTGPPPKARLPDVDEVRHSLEPAMLRRDSVLTVTRMMDVCRLRRYNTHSTTLPRSRPCL